MPSHGAKPATAVEFGGSAISTIDISPGPQPVPLKRRHVAAVVIGNALEFYDFLTFAFFGTDAFVSLTFSDVRDQPIWVAGLALTGATEIEVN